METIMGMDKEFFLRAYLPIMVYTYLPKILLFAVLCAGVFYLRGIYKNSNRQKMSEEVKQVRRSLAEVLKEHRTRCKMTQEFVAESIGVSRQAVSKWESGASEPNTSNLVALAKLYGVPADELLRSVEAGLEKDTPSEKKG